MPAGTKLCCNFVCALASAEEFIKDLSGLRSVAIGDILYNINFHYIILFPYPWELGYIFVLLVHLSMMQSHDEHVSTELHYFYPFGYLHCCC